MTTTPRRVKVERGVYQRPGRDGYEIGWRDAQGKQRWRKVNGGIRAARAALGEEIARRERGERVAADPRLMFATAAGKWWDAHVVRLRPTTQENYHYALRHILATFGQRRLADITPAELAAYVAAKERAGLKGWTIKSHLVVLGGVYGYAARHLGFAGTNPAPLLSKVERPSSNDEKAKRILTRDELTRLLAAIDERHRLIFRVAASTGCRLGEVLGLTWKDIDLAGPSVTFTHQLDRKGQRVPLKTKRSRRTLEIGDHLGSELRRAKMAAGGEGLVFVNRQGRPHDHRNIGRILARAVEKAGLGGDAAPSMHSLRHTHASELIAAGWDLEEVSARLGHANVATTARIYIGGYDVGGRSEERRRRLVAMEGVEALAEATGGTERDRRGDREARFSLRAAK
jgi:integrase